MTQHPHRNVALKDLRGLLREALQPRREGDVFVSLHLHAIVDMARIEGGLRALVEKKLRRVSFSHLFIAPLYKEMRDKLLGPLIVSAPNRDSAMLLEEWGQSNGDIVSAWIVSALPEYAIAQHLRHSAFAYDKNQQVFGRDKVYMLRFYDPVIMPVLHRLADKKWIEWFFGPIQSWWYPVATPREETWSRIEGGSQNASGEPVPMVLSEELWDALDTDPFPYRVLSIADQTCPTAFGRDCCYGVRLARVEELLDAAKKQRLKTEEDLITYVLSLLDNPDRAKERQWQEAMKAAVLGEASLASGL